MQQQEPCRQGTLAVRGWEGVAGDGMGGRRRVPGPLAWPLGGCPSGTPPLWLLVRALWVPSWKTRLG